MSYLAELYELSKTVTKSEEFNLGQRAIMLEMIDSRITEEEASDDYFIRFFEDVVDESIGFDFKSVLSDSTYESASQEAQACIGIFPEFAKMEATSSVLPWIITALKYTDQIVLHYIQDILNKKPVTAEGVGVERSRYIQIKEKNQCTAYVAGQVLDLLYDQRNKLEHRSIKDPKDESKQIIVVPNYLKAKRKIQKGYPKALKSFRKAYIEHYD